MSLSTSFLILSIPLLALYLLQIRRRRSHLPPGPKPLPIFGNILQIQGSLKHKEPLWITFSDWSKRYGEVFTFSVLGSRTVVLNSHKAMLELLDQRSQNYSDRPLMRYSDSWRLHRRTFQQYFQPRTVPNYYHIQKERTVLLMRKLKTSPKEFFRHARMHTGGIILEIVYGYHIKDNNDPYVKMADEALVGVTQAGIPGSFLVDFIPLLKYVPAWFPGADFKVKADIWKRAGHRLRDVPWMLLKQSVVKNMEKHGVLPSSSEMSPMEEVIKNCAGLAFEGKPSPILTFILAMVLHPQIQAHAQRELDEVIGSSRLPDFSDREILPHRTVSDDLYEGHLIPGGSTIVANVWAVLRDESLYGPGTSSFNPERFMKQDNSDGKDLPPNPELIVFGFGRRICPGRHLAINSI
ncbi:cytochrome P450 [Marasmius fiardii PR-910]|nr:cytochrome P450 [Marasmius fiardii PR-910]